MARNPATQENLTKASQTAAMLLSDLREALKTASDLEGILLLHQIHAVCEVANVVERIAEAKS